MIRDHRTPDRSGTIMGFVTGGNGFCSPMGSPFRLRDAVIARHSTGRSSIPEAVVLDLKASGILDAPLKAGHDSGKDVTQLSRGRFRPSYAWSMSLETQRAQGMPGEGLTHGPPATRKAGGSHHRISRINRHSLRDGLRLIRDLPGVPGFLAAVALRIIAARLDPSVGGSGPHDFAVRIGRVRQLRQSVHRIPLPTSVTIAKRPSDRERDAYIMHYFCFS